MGHLSTNDRVSTELPSNGFHIANGNASTILKRNGSVVAKGDDVSHIEPEVNVKKTSNGFTSNGSGNILNGNATNGCSATPKDTKIPSVKQHNIDLDEYTRNFKGDNILGWQFKAPLKWDKVIQIFLLHIVCVICILTYPLEQLNLYTVLWSFFTGGVAGFGVTAGAHRFWTHRAYKANLPLRIILMACFSLAGQNTLYDWVRDHRVHHRFSETDADPHNSNRGFFFAHVGWLMMLKHPEVLRRGREVDMSNVLDDPVVQFHQKYFIPLKIMLCFVLPTLVPIYFWGEHWYMAVVTQCIFRYVSSLNFTWSVNSAAHMWGSRPYNKRIQPSENIYVSILAMGEGWHNYHHVFPWDYKAAELGKYSVNFTTMLLDMFHKMGWAWNMKEPPKELVRKFIENHGDGTHESLHEMDHGHGHCHPPEVPDPEDGAESSSTESSKLDENDNMRKHKKSYT